MATSNAIVSIGTTLNASSLQSYASDAGFVSAKGSSASDGDIYYNTTLDTLRLYANSAWTSLADKHSLVTYADDASFVTGKGSSAANGDIYYNTTDDSIHIYLNGAWVAIRDDRGDSRQLNNLSISASVATNALTVALKDAAGANASADNPIYVGFRSATASSGVYNRRSVTGALSVTVPDTATLGHASNVAHYIYVYLLDNAGTVELALSSIILDEGSVQSTTAVGTGSDSIRGFYSTTLRSNVPIRLIGRILSTQATAGTWASAPTEVSVGSFTDQIIHADYSTNVAQAVASGTDVTIDFEDKIQDTHNTVVVGTWTWTCPKTAVYIVSASARLSASASWDAGEAIEMKLRIDGSTVKIIGRWEAHESTTLAAHLYGCVALRIVAGEVVTIVLDQNSGSSIALTGEASRNWVTITEIPGKV